MITPFILAFFLKMIIVDIKKGRIDWLILAIACVVLPYPKSEILIILTLSMQAQVN